MEIIQFLIFGIFIAAVIVRPLVKGSAKAETARKLRPMPACPPEEETEAETIVPELHRQKHTPRKPAVPSSPGTKAQAVTSSPKGESIRAASGRRIRINTREEARRAFIYSQIFNRKY